MRFGRGLRSFAHGCSYFSLAVGATGELNRDLIRNLNVLLFSRLRPFRKIFSKRHHLQMDHNDENMNEDRVSIVTDFSYVNEDV